MLLLAVLRSEGRMVQIAVPGVFSNAPSICMVAVQIWLRTYF